MIGNLKAAVKALQDKWPGGMTPAEGEILSQMKQAVIHAFDEYHDGQEAEARFGLMMKVIKDYWDDPRIGTSEIFEKALRAYHYGDDGEPEPARPSRRQGEWYHFDPQLSGMTDQECLFKFDHMNSSSLLVDVEGRNFHEEFCKPAIDALKYKRGAMVAWSKGKTNIEAECDGYDEQSWNVYMFSGPDLDSSTPYPKGECTLLAPTPELQWKPTS